MRRNLVNQFASLWNESNTSADVVVFLDEHQSSTLEEKLSVLLVHQDHCWRAGKAVSVEQYLAQFPELDRDDKAVLELIMGELRAREAKGHVVPPDELARRFPRLTNLIESRLSECPTGEMRADEIDKVGSAPTVSYHGMGFQEQIGRYRLIRLLGKGGYGHVWLAFDGDLERPVAIKIPNPGQFRRVEDAETYLDEARAVATLDHPNIVPVHDVGRTGDGQVYIVSKFIEGQDLATRIKERPLTFPRSAQIVASIAQALHHAHTRHLIHRDVKPSNILIEEATQQSYLSDFGLAIREEDYLRNRSLAGTPSYMSPEQARGEGHRLGGSSDIFSLGTVLYVLLTGKNPFQVGNADQTRANVVSLDPTPPQELNKEVPSELQRICLKAMSKRASDRYATAVDFADDLQHWLTEPDQKSEREITVIPKGLRSFDADDAYFFLDLLPGPRDRAGLPESVLFLKTRMEETDPDKTFAVGLLYGPSGCGKSSMIKAGVLPAVSNDILKVYVEATPDQTEIRLLRAVQKQVPSLPEGRGLAESFAILRRGSERKVVVVIDQFEQWLHVNRNEAACELISALRQCDGRKIQAICLVRDDFAMAAARFMGELDVPIVQGHNFATVDLFDVDHARKVLAKFGRAFGKVTSDPAGQADQQAFLTAVASGLARDNRVVPVRLALFAEMIKDKPWTLSTLDEVGGMEGIGVNFLEETFTSRAANPKHRLHQKAARSVLRLLLPEAGTNIKGNMRSYEELLDVSGYGARVRDFRELLGILDGELRLITPTDPEEDSGTEADQDAACKYYQLTHDYLIPSLREWLTRKQKETRKGRAELRLEEMAAHWSTKPETRHLPSLWEWMNIRLLTEKKRWTGPQREMMRVAARVRGSHWMAALLVVVMLLGALQWYLSARRIDDEQKRANLLVDALFAAPAELVPYAIQNVRPLTWHVLPILRERFERSEDPTEQLRAACALSEYGDNHVPFLLASIEWAPRRECPNIVKALRQSRSVTIQALHERARDADADQQLSLMARLAIVGLHLGDANVARDMFRSGPDLVQRTVLIDTIPTWYGTVNQWIEPTSMIEDADFRSGICLGLGSIPVDDFDAHEIQEWEALFQDWFQNHPSGVIHSSAGWALQRWKSPLPEIAPSPQPVEDRGWYVNSIGMTMLLSPAGTFVRQVPGPNDDFFENYRNQTVTVTQSFWISDREVSRAQFQRFIDEVNESSEEKPMNWEGAKMERSPTSAHPVQNVSWFQAVMFCNWLSGIEQLTPCYEKTDSGWILNSEASGYRLPFEAEWEHACRAGTRTLYSWGNEDSYLSKYAVCLANRTEKCGSKLPNAWGLFDTHGNIREWCQDWYKEFPEVDSLVDPQGPEKGSLRALRGGAFDYGPTVAFSSCRRWARPAYRSFTIGFRVVHNSTKTPTGAIQ